MCHLEHARLSDNLGSPRVKCVTVGAGPEAINSGFHYEWTKNLFRMKNYDPIQEINHLVNPIYGLKRRILNFNPVALRQSGTLGNGQTPHLDLGVRCWLVGWKSMGQKLLELSETTYQFAWEDRNTSLVRKFLLFSQSTAINGLFLARWLARKMNDPIVGRLAEERLKELFLEEPKKIKMKIDYHAAELWDCGAHETFLEVSAAGGCTYSRPRSLSNYFRPRVMVWILGSDEFSEDEKQHWMKKFLDRNLPEYLAGHEMDAARWIKIAYARNGETSLSPFEVVRKIYDHLPNVEMPPESECPIDL